MKKKQRRMVRILAIVLAALLAGSALISALVSIAYAEEAIPARNSHTLTMEYLENEQALRISQRLVYINDSIVHLDRVMFYAPANLLRRLNAMAYAEEDLSAAYPKGYVPGGVDIASIQVNGVPAEWGFQGDTEIYLRVACDLNPNQSCEFSFDYYLLLSENNSFAGVQSNLCRLSNFYFAPASLDASRGEFILNAPLSFSEYIETPPADFTAQIALPKAFSLAAAGRECFSEGENGLRIWEIQAAGAYDFSLAFGQFHETLGKTPSGLELRCLTESKGSAKRLLNIAEKALASCENWFGALPSAQIDLVQAGIARPFTAHSGAIWLSDELLQKKNEAALAHALRFAISKQYFGFSARARVSSDAWLSDSVSEYIAYLLLEDAEGHNAYLQALNAELVSSLQLTIPGGLAVTSDAALFSPYEYEIVILDRGAAVFHELRTAMGLDSILAGFRNFYEAGLSADVLTEMDLVNAMDSASGSSWEKFLTDWVFNIGEYVNQTIDWLD